MFASETTLPGIILLVGATIVLALLIKSGLGRLGVPSLIGFLLLGFGLRLSRPAWDNLAPQLLEIYEFLAQMGIICLLFRVGLESNLAGLWRQFRRASILWAGNVCCAGLLGYVAAVWCGLSMATSLVVATALTATSVGVAVSVWQEAGAMHSPNGELLLDVAEMDDISGIIFMALLFAVIPLLVGEQQAAVLDVLLWTLGVFAVHFVAFGSFCVLFSAYVESSVTLFFRNIEPAPDPMLTVLGIGFIIAALAALLGFSVAIGAFFAGLVFSRDPQAVQMDASFSPLYDLFTPFFFIGIGLHIDPHALTGATGLGIILLLAAVFGKVLGTSVPACLIGERASALVLGMSMIPRAEIAMIIVQRGQAFGADVVPPGVFAAMVMVSMGTCILTPLLLHRLLRHGPPGNPELPS